MFWKETSGLNQLSNSSKIALSAFLLIAGIGYIFGFFNIYLTYSPVDQQPGLSVNDIRLTFYGAREATRMERSIDGTMRQYFQADSEYDTVKTWIAQGGKEKDFPVIKEIFDRACNTCHSAEAQVAGVVTVTYQDVQPYLKQDTGKSLARLVSLSHTHIYGIVTVIFLLALIFSFTRYPEGLKIAVMGLGFLSVLIDVGAWWLAKLSAALAPLVMVGGISVAVSFLLLILLPLYEIWLKKA